MDAKRHLENKATQSKPKVMHSNLEPTSEQRMWASEDMEVGSGLREIP